MKRDEIEEYISDPNRLYRILTGNGVFLPPQRSRVSTYKFLFAVFQNKAWLPLIKEVKVRKCVIMPPIEAIAEECAATIMTCANDEHKNSQYYLPMIATAKQMAKYCKDKDFMLTLIATLKPEHHFFHIDYVPAGKFVQKRRGDEMIDVAKGYVIDQERFRHIKSKSGRKRGIPLYLTKLEREQKQRDKLQERARKVSEALRLQEERVEEAKREQDEDDGPEIRSVAARLEASQRDEEEEKDGVDPLNSTGIRPSLAGPPVSLVGGRPTTTLTYLDPDPRTFQEAVNYPREKHIGQLQQASIKTRKQRKEELAAKRAARQQEEPMSQVSNVQSAFNGSNNVEMQSEMDDF